MEDKDLFGSPNQIYFCSKGDATNLPPLPVVADSTIWEAPDPETTPILDENGKPLSYSFECKPTKEIDKLFRPLNIAQRMLDDLKRDARDFNTNPPKNRKQRRERQRMIREKLKRFNAYCREHNITLQKGES